nr:MAG TPA: hypothetical protein [Caudoviricetes sp.]DAR62658.1 MAG TPA: hypothetical protein [Caudoviricetes sp.]
MSLFLFYTFVNQNIKPVKIKTIFIAHKKSQSPP